MKFAVNFLQSFPRNVGIDLRGCDIGMAQHNLHGTQIGAAFQKMRRKGMPECMRINLLLQSRLTRTGNHDLQNPCLVNFSEPAQKQNIRAFFCMNFGRISST